MRAHAVPEVHAHDGNGRVGRERDSQSVVQAMPNDGNVQQDMEILPWEVRERADTEKRVDEEGDKSEERRHKDKLKVNPSKIHVELNGGKILVEFICMTEIASEL